MALEECVRMLFSAYLAGFVGAAGSPFFVADMIHLHRGKKIIYITLECSHELMDMANGLYDKSQSNGCNTPSPNYGLAPGVTIGLIVAPAAMPCVALLEFSRLTYDWYCNNEDRSV